MDMIEVSMIDVSWTAPTDARDANALRDDVRMRSASPHAGDAGYRPEPWPASATTCSPTSAKASAWKHWLEWPA
jgi:hypothetical protein